MEIPFLIQRK